MQKKCNINVSCPKLIYGTLQKKPIIKTAAINTNIIIRNL